jgi:hypothetical protein
MLIKEVNLKRDRPVVEEAKRRLVQALENARRERTLVLRIVHGYGSHGTGGAIREEVREQLAELKRQGNIRGLIFGERLSPFFTEAVQALDRFPELNRLPDWNAGNEGITIVLI